MSTIEIDTTQNVSIRFQTANVLERILSRIIDGVIATVFLYACFLPLGLLSFNDSGVTMPWLLTTLAVLVFVLVFFYSFIMESIFHGQTVGKMAMNIRVVRMDGTEPSIGNYAVRFLVAVFEVTMTFGVVATIASLVSKSGQRLGDMAAGTLVVRKARKVTLAQVGMVADAPQHVIKYHSAGSLSPADVEVLKEVLHEAKVRSRTSDATHIVLEAAKRRIEVVLRESSDDAALIFLLDVLADYNAIHGSAHGAMPLGTTSDTVRRG